MNAASTENTYYILTSSFGLSSRDWGKVCKPAMELLNMVRRNAVGERCLEEEGALFQVSSKIDNLPIVKLAYNRDLYSSPRQNRIQKASSLLNWLSFSLPRSNPLFRLFQKRGKKKAGIDVLKAPHATCKHVECLLLSHPSDMRDQVSMVLN